VRKFKLKKEELDGAPTTNGNLQPKELKHNVQKKNYSKNSRAFENPLFHTLHTHEQIVS